MKLTGQLSLALLLGQSALIAQPSAFFHVPGELFVGGTNREGNSVLQGGPIRNVSRFQQVYNASLFSTLPGGAGFITGLSFRADGPTGHGFFTTVTDMQITLSVTPKGPDSLSPVFDENVGPFETIVFPLGQGQRIGGGPSQDGPGVWGPDFDISGPGLPTFFYDPSEGNLLIDIQTFTGLGAALSPLDAQRVAGDSVSTVLGFGIDSLPNSGQLDTLGLVTRFIITPIPEPSTHALFAIGLSLSVVSLLHRKRKRKANHAAC